MFGLSRREQRWKAEEKAAEMLLGLLVTTVNAKRDIRIAEANAEMASELKKLREENARLLKEINA